MPLIRGRTNIISEISIDEDLDMGTPGYDILLGGQKLMTTNLLLKQGSATSFYIRDVADNNYKNITLATLIAHSSIQAGADGIIISGKNTNANYIAVQVRDTGSGLVEIARLVGAAEPYFQATLPMVLKPYATFPAVEGAIGYHSTPDRIMFRDSAALKHLAPWIVRKTADETVTGSTTLQDDNALLMAIAAGEVWVYQIHLKVDTDNTADFKFAITVPGGATVAYGLINSGWATGGAAAFQSLVEEASAQPISVSGTGSKFISVSIWVYAANSTTPGNVTLQWAQNTSDGSNTIVKAGSHMIGYQL